MIMALVYGVYSIYEFRRDQRLTAVFEQSDPLFDSTLQEEGDAKAADQQQEPEWVCDSSLRPGEVVDVATSASCMVAPGRMSLSVAVDGSIERRQFVREVSSATRIDRRKVGFGFVLR